MSKPILIYDGSCKMCSRWAAHQKPKVAGVVDFEAYQTAAKRFPGVAYQTFENALQFVDEHGRFYSGAAAVVELFQRMPGGSVLWWYYYRLPGFRHVANVVYSLVAHHRRFFSRIFLKR